jgi:DNA-directed RNA polymerase specialized sigma24 family protein
MTPTEDATFIALWQQGVSHDAMAQQLGIPLGTVRAWRRRGWHTLRPWESRSSSRRLERTKRWDLG